MNSTNEPLITIIVPAYNAQEYISECIDSVLNQTYSQWELLIIDDGSTDQTPAFVDQFVKKDPRIYLYHQVNKGVSAARNYGLELARGEFIVFLDSDDLLTQNSIQTRVEAIQGADMAICGYLLFNGGTLSKKMPSASRDTWNRDEAIGNIAIPGELGYQGFLWNKIFRRRIISDNGLCFANGIAYNEDRLYCVSYAILCSRVKLSNETVYYYRQCPTSAMSSLSRMSDNDYCKILSEFTAYDKMLELLKESHELYYYLTALDAHRRAVVLKRTVSKNEKKLNCAFGQAIERYGHIVLRAPLYIIPLKTRIKVLGHVALRC